jgi:NAD(P)H-flavin reductase
MYDRGRTGKQKITIPIYLYIGLNFVEDIFWKEHLDQLCSKHPNFHYEIAIWKPDETWKGHKGFVTELLAKDFPDASTCAAYICGAAPMVESVTKQLLSSNCPKERIYMEKF